MDEFSLMLEEYTSSSRPWACIRIIDIFTLLLNIGNKALLGAY